MRNVIRRTGINPDDYTQIVRDSEGVGGPEIPLRPVQVEGISDPAFSIAYLRAVRRAGPDGHTVCRRCIIVPLTMPVAGAQFERTSGFGARVDPFTGRYCLSSRHRFRRPVGLADARRRRPDV